MPTVDAEVIGGSGLIETTSGLEKRRVYRVYGFDVATDPDSREVDALAEVPAIGTVFSPLPTLRVEQREVTAHGADHLEVTVTYRTPSGNRVIEGDEPQIEIQSSLETVRTDVDKDDNLITVDYTAPTGSDFDDIRESIKEVRLQKPTFGIRYTRRENISGSTLSNTAATFNGHVNSTAFAGLSPRTLLALITGRSDDGGDTFVVNYVFFYEPGTWDAVVKATDPETGQIPPDVTEGNGQTTATIYPEADFNALNL